MFPVCSVLVIEFRVTDASEPGGAACASRTRDRLLERLTMTSMTISAS
jgi:hypothetical protein